MIEHPCETLQINSNFRFRPALGAVPYLSDLIMAPFSGISGSAPWEADSDGIEAVRYLPQRQRVFP